MNILKNIFYNNILVIICLIFLSSCNDNELLINPPDGSEYSMNLFEFTPSYDNFRSLNFNAGKSSRNYIGRFSEYSDSYTLFKIDPALISPASMKAALRGIMILPISAWSVYVSLEGRVS